MTLTVLHILPADGIAAAKQVRLLREFGSGDVAHKTLTVSSGSQSNGLAGDDGAFRFRFPTLDRYRFTSTVKKQQADVVHVWPMPAQLGSCVGSGLGSNRVVVSFAGDVKRLPLALVRRAARITLPLNCLAKTFTDRVQGEVVCLPPPVCDQIVGWQSDKDTSFPTITTHSSFTFDECLKEMLWSGSMLEQLGSFRIHVLGDAPLRSTLEDYANRIHVYGDTALFANEYDNEAALNDSNCYWSATRRSCFQYGMLIALARGLPAIAMDNDVHRELIHGDSRCGELIAGSSVAFAKSTLRLLENTDSYARYREAAVNSVREHNLASRVVPIYEQFYREI